MNRCAPFIHFYTYITLTKLLLLSKAQPKIFGKIHFEKENEIPIKQIVSDTFNIRPCWTTGYFISGNVRKMFYYYLCCCRRIFVSNAILYGVVCLVMYVVFVHTFLVWRENELRKFCEEKYFVTSVGNACFLLGWLKTTFMLSILYIHHHHHQHNIF